MPGDAADVTMLSYHCSTASESDPICYCYVCSDRYSLIFLFVSLICLYLSTTSEPTLPKNYGCQSWRDCSANHACSN